MLASTLIIRAQARLIGSHHMFHLLLFVRVSLKVCEILNVVLNHFYNGGFVSHRFCLQTLQLVLRTSF